MLCDRCFATIDASLAACSECGAPIEAGSVDATDRSIYPELARANLLRLRGDYHGAEHQCLQILHRLPNNATAHTLLGDLHAEQGNLDQAITWYELALDLNPTSTVDKSKLEGVRERQRANLAMTSAEQLGLPSARTSQTLWAGIAVAAVAMVGFGAFFIGQQLGSTPRPAVNRTLQVPIEAPAVTEPVSTPPSNGSEPDKGAPSDPPARTVEPVRMAGVDRDFAAQLGQRSGHFDLILGVVRDPRAKIVTLTLAVTGSPDPEVRRFATQMGLAALELDPELSLVTLRCVDGDRLTLVGDILRSRVAALPPGTDPVEAGVLSNLWPPVPATGTAESGSGGG